MNVSTTIPATVEMRRSRLIGLVAAVAAVAVGITWALFTFAGDTGTESAQKGIPAKTAALSSLSQSERQYVNGIASLTRVEQAAAFGGPGGVLDALGLSAKERQYVNGIASLTRVEQAAAFGGPGGVLDALGLDAQDKQYVQGITSLSPAQLKAGFGTGR